MYWVQMVATKPACSQLQSGVSRSTSATIMSSFFTLLSHIPRSNTQQLPIIPASCLYHLHSLLFLCLQLPHSYLYNWHPVTQLLFFSFSICLHQLCFLYSKQCCLIHSFFYNLRCDQIHPVNFKLIQQLILTYLKQTLFDCKKKIQL